MAYSHLNKGAYQSIKVDKGAWQGTVGTVTNLAINYFNISQAGDNTSVTSTVNVPNLVNLIQTVNPDTYFDSTDKISKVLVHYTHSVERQTKRLLHDGVSRQVKVSWSPYAQDGTWYKSKVIAYNHEGSSVVIPRVYLDSTNDNIYHLSGIMHLNVIIC
jgi:hypothetical protein